MDSRINSNENNTDILSIDEWISFIITSKTMFLVKFGEIYVKHVSFWEEMGGYFNQKAGFGR